MSANPPDINPVPPKTVSPAVSSSGPAPLAPVKDQVAENNKLAEQAQAENAAKDRSIESPEPSAPQADDKEEKKKEANEPQKVELKKPNQQEPNTHPMVQLANDLLETVANNNKALWEAVKRPVDAVKGMADAVDSKIKVVTNEFQDIKDGLNSTKDFFVGVASKIGQKANPVALSPAEDTKMNPKQELSDEKSSGYDSAAQKSTSTPSPTADSTKENEQGNGPNGP